MGWTKRQPTPQEDTIPTASQPSLPSRLRGFGLTPAFHEVERHVLPALHAYRIPSSKPAVQGPNVPSGARTPLTLDGTTWVPWMDITLQRSE
jgi:hypothetical protein